MELETGGAQESNPTLKPGGSRCGRVKTSQPPAGQISEKQSAEEKSGFN